MASFIRIDTRFKVAESETHIFFQGGEFSQWHRSEFRAMLPSHLFKNEHRFNCAEQYMMACKALRFLDYDALMEIMIAKEPREHKEIGRRVEGYDDLSWREVARDHVTVANYAKFTQNPDLKAVLLETGDKILVEGAHYDPVWGVKIAWNDPLILDPKNWQGTNWLGEVLMNVRQMIRLEDEQAAG